VVGGLLTSQLITLYLTPVVFLYMDGAWRWLATRRGKPVEQSAAASVPAT